jgi:hypothetical protein
MHIDVKVLKKLPDGWRHLLRNGAFQLALKGIECRLNLPGRCGQS